MSEAVTIPVLILASVEEQAAMAKAGALTAGLAGEAGQAWDVVCELVESAKAIPVTTGPAVLVTSMSDELATLDEPWPLVEARLRARYEGFAERPELLVFICTLFRHVSRDLPPEQRYALGVRIRRLNFLALDLSRALGVMIADVDRDLSDKGAGVYATDWRLKGDYAAMAAGKSLAMAILHVGLDDFVPFELQEAVRERVRAYEPPQAVALAPVPQSFGGQVSATRSRSRVQMADYAQHAPRTDVAASHVKRLLKGETSPVLAVKLMIKSARSRGLKQSVSRLLQGLSKALGEGKASRS